MRALLIVVMAFVTACGLAQETDLLNHSVVGSESCDNKGPCYNRVMDDVRVQKFFLDLARAPIEVSSAKEALRGTAVSDDDLLTLGLVRRDHERYILNFPLFTAADVNLVRERSERYASSLADAILQRRSEFERALGGYDAPGVDRKAVAYFLLGCVSLDWDGLDITAEKHYRKTAEEHPDGRYVPDAEEKTNRSLQGIYWGSHNSRFGETGFTSFGDHFSRRFTLPDLIWGISARIAPRPGDPPGSQEALQAMVSASLEQSAANVGRVMLALREGEKTAEELATATKLAPDDAKSLLHALAALDYVREKNGRYYAIVPVLTERDRAISDRVRKIGREVIESWLAANYGHMKSEMQDLSFMRSGVPFESGYTMIWHYVFGIANRKLVEAGLFADPYAADRKFKGSIPAVYSLEY